MARLMSSSRFQHTPGDTMVYGGILLILTLLHIPLSLFSLFLLLNQNPFWYGTIVAQIAILTVPSFGSLIIREPIAARALRWGFLVGLSSAFALCYYLFINTGKSFLQQAAASSEPLTITNGIMIHFDGGSIFPPLFWFLIPCTLCAFFVRLRTSSSILAIGSAIFALCFFTLGCLTLHPFFLQGGQNIYWPLWIADYALLVRIYASPLLFMLLLSIGTGIVGAGLGSLFSRLFINRRLK